MRACSAVNQLLQGARKTHGQERHSISTTVLLLLLFWQALIHETAKPTHVPVQLFNYADMGPCSPLLTWQPLVSIEAEAGVFYHHCCSQLQASAANQHDRKSQQVGSCGLLARLLHGLTITAGPLTLFPCFRSWGLMDACICRQTKHNGANLTHCCCCCCCCCCCYLSRAR
jgi:hypothetical protein